MYHVWEEVSDEDIRVFGDAYMRYQSLGQYGPIGSFLRSLNVVYIDNESLFAHGGVSKTVALKTDAEHFNQWAKKWMNGVARDEEVLEHLSHKESPLMYRGYALNSEEEACAELEIVLKAWNVCHYFLSLSLILTPLLGQENGSRPYHHGRWKDSLPLCRQ